VNLPSPYATERQALRLRLQENRLPLIQATSVTISIQDEKFPRSITMRLITGSPGVIPFLITEVFPFLLGLYLSKRRKKHS
jgi:hypothetical protein